MNCSNPKNHDIQFEYDLIAITIEAFQVNKAHPLPRMEIIRERFQETAITQHLNLLRGVNLRYT